MPLEKLTITPPPDPVADIQHRQAAALPWWSIWLIVVGVALTLRLLVLASGAVSFHSDEAIVGLMARHINAGLPIPTFFYGQVYMGSLDALLVALGFRILGDNTLTIRLAESALYLLMVMTTMLLAHRVSGGLNAGRRGIALAAGLLVAIPPVVMTLYTTMTLGGYGETLLFGNLILWLGFELGDPSTFGSDRPPKAVGQNALWALLGLITGIGWWTNGLIVVYALPVVLWNLPHFSVRRWRSYALAAVTFLIGGSPWWVYNLGNHWDALRWLIGGLQTDSGIAFSPGVRALGLVFVGLPAAMGIRYSWTSQYWAGSLSAVIVAVYIMALMYAGRGALRRKNADFGVRYLLLAIVSFMVIFVVSAFGSDATGRYLLPLIPMLSIVLAYWAHSLWQMQRLLAFALMGGLLMFGLAGNLVAMTTIPPGITSQFDPINDFRNDYDQAVVDFLEAHGGTRGYGTYWVTFRLAFVSHEQVIIDAWLPNKASLLYTPLDRRYPPYTAQVEAADHVVYVTANLPQLDSIIAQRFEAAKITYQRQAIGPYTVFYDLSQRVTPVELGLESLGSAP